MPVLMQVEKDLAACAEELAATVRDRDAAREVARRCFESWHLWQEHGERPFCGPCEGEIEAIAAAHPWLKEERIIEAGSPQSGAGEGKMKRGGKREPWERDLWSGGIFFTPRDLEANPQQEQFEALVDAKLANLRESLLDHWKRERGVPAKRGDGEEA